MIYPPGHGRPTPRPHAPCRPSRPAPSRPASADPTDRPTNNRPTNNRLNAGFINEMRRVAMKLHTKDQAPKEGGVEVPKEEKKAVGDVGAGVGQF